LKLYVYLKVSLQNLHKDTFVNILKRLFLPSGYPESVTEDFANFERYEAPLFPIETLLLTEKTRWDALQGLCSYLRQVMVTRSTLSGLGVGNNVAQPTAAALMLVM